MAKAKNIPKAKGIPKAKSIPKVGPLDKNFVLEDYVLYNLIRAASTYTAEMDAALKKHGLNTTKWRILSLLKDKSPSSVSEMARRSATKLPTLTRMLTRMEKEGLITRASPDEDRRVVEVRMTAEAEITLQLVKSIGQRVFEKAFTGIDGAELQKMTSTLKKVRENLNLSHYEMPELAATSRGGHER